MPIELKNDLLSLGLHMLPKFSEPNVDGNERDKLLCYLLL